MSRGAFFCLFFHKASRRTGRPKRAGDPPGTGRGEGMAVKFQSVAGMKDILPEETPLWQDLEKVLREVVRSYGYAEIRMPAVESTSLFVRSIGEVTDVVEKEMYTFDDNGDSLSLRPEGTAGCVRACIESGIIHNQERRLWYMGPMFRHERPQKGRYRQFHQFGVEVFGLAGPEIEAELILMIARIWRIFGISDRLTLELNSLGTPEERVAYRASLVDYLRAHQDQLDDDSRRRMETNPLRVLDSKDPGVQEVLSGAPVLSSCFGEETRQRFERLQQILRDAGVPFRINERLVRGLDYYSHTVFEWVTDALGAQSTVCGGGRYDGLVEQLGGHSTPAVGFAIGLERMVLLLKTLEACSAAPAAADVYLCAMGDEAVRRSFILGEQIRSEVPGIRLLTNCAGGAFRKQFRRADQSGAAFALILGESELEQGMVGIKDLRQGTEQRNVPWGEAAAELKNLLGV